MGRTLNNIRVNRSSLLMLILVSWLLLVVFHNEKHSHTSLQYFRKSCGSTPTGEARLPKRRRLEIEKLISMFELHHCIYRILEMSSALVPPSSSDTHLKLRPLRSRTGLSESPPRVTPSARAKTWRCCEAKSIIARLVPFWKRRDASLAKAEYIYLGGCVRYTSNFRHILPFTGILGLFFKLMSCLYLGTHVSYTKFETNDLAGFLKISL